MAWESKEEEAKDFVKGALTALGADRDYYAPENRKAFHDFYIWWTKDMVRLEPAEEEKWSPMP